MISSNPSRDSDSTLMLDFPFLYVMVNLMPMLRRRPAEGSLRPGI